MQSRFLGAETPMTARYVLSEPKLRPPEEKRVPASLGMTTNCVFLEVLKGALRRQADWDLSSSLRSWKTS